MSSDRTSNESPPRNLFDEMLEQFRSEYAEKHGEQPPEEVMKTVRSELLQGIAREKRDKNRDIYDKLARE